jgi:hypothetical protein
LLADQLVEGSGGAALPPPEPDPVIGQRVAALAERLEALAASLENEAADA